MGMIALMFESGKRHLFWYYANSAFGLSWVVTVYYYFGALSVSNG